MLYFSRSSPEAKEECFYSCAAYRSPELCASASKARASMDRSQYDAIRNQVLPQLAKLPPSQRGFCRTCSLLFLEGHQGHNIIFGLDDRLIRCPSKVRSFIVKFGWTLFNSIKSAKEQVILNENWSERKMVNVMFFLIHEILVLLCLILIWNFSISFSYYRRWTILRRRHSSYSRIGPSTPCCRCSRRSTPATSSALPVPPSSRISRPDKDRAAPASCWTSTCDTYVGLDETR